MISNSTKEMVWTLYEIDKMKKSHIAKKLGISRDSVYEVLKDETYKNQHLTDIYKHNKIEQAESLLKALQEDKRTKGAIDKILNIVNDKERLEVELEKQGGLRAVMGVMKIIVDTNRSALSSDIEERRVIALEKQVKLKEQELELRQSNPEAFIQPIIVDDSKKVAEWYEKNGTDKPYSQN